MQKQVSKDFQDCKAVTCLFVSLLDDKEEEMLKPKLSKKELKKLKKQVCRI